MSLTEPQALSDYDDEVCISLQHVISSFSWNDFKSSNHLSDGETLTNTLLKRIKEIMQHTRYTTSAWCTLKDKG